ncbi:hypothetical protein F5Y19DRAFT_479872 [Xylariaceae sp. FL1651]|nr:hypothetical protein F5Y19DRAFT_479872 [Xylariaceae sp. FL1651]
MLPTLPPTPRRNNRGPQISDDTDDWSDDSDFQGSQIPSRTRSSSNYGDMNQMQNRLRRRMSTASGQPADDNDYLNEPRSHGPRHSRVNRPPPQQHSSYGAGGQINPYYNRIPFVPPSGYSFNGPPPSGYSFSGPPPSGYSFNGPPPPPPPPQHPHPPIPIPGAPYAPYETEYGVGYGIENETYNQRPPFETGYGARYGVENETYNQRPPFESSHMHASIDAEVDDYQKNAEARLRREEREEARKREKKRKRREEAAREKAVKEDLEQRMERKLDQIRTELTTEMKKTGNATRAEERTERGSSLGSEDIMRGLLGALSLAGRSGQDQSLYGLRDLNMDLALSRRGYLNSRQRAPVWYDNLTGQYDDDMLHKMDEVIAMQKQLAIRLGRHRQEDELSGRTYLTNSHDHEYEQSLRDGHSSHFPRIKHTDTHRINKDHKSRAIYRETRSPTAHSSPRTPFSPSSAPSTRGSGSNVSSRLDSEHWSDRGHNKQHTYHTRGRTRKRPQYLFKISESTESNLAVLEDDIEDTRPRQTQRKKPGRSARTIDNDDYGGDDDASDSGKIDSRYARAPAVGTSGREKKKPKTSTITIETSEKSSRSRKAPIKVIVTQNDPHESPESEDSDIDVFPHHPRAYTRRPDPKHSRLHTRKEMQSPMPPKVPPKAPSVPQSEDEDYDTTSDESEASARRSGGRSRRLLGRA